VVKLPNSESATRELLVEAEILTKIAQYLRHPNLIALTSVDKYVIEWAGKQEDRWFLVLQFGGMNLRGRLGRLGLRQDEYVYLNGAPLPLEDVFHIAIQASDGLRALHEFEESPGQHIIHRDIKPENILIDEHGTVRLADFGISKIVERLTQSVTAAGTAPYLAPEYSRGRLHACSDIYSLGIVLYEMATGKFPFRPDRGRPRSPEAKQAPGGVRSPGRGLEAEPGQSRRPSHTG
jgi:eukaryotic-like serine/threonine-protein kinase